LRGKGEKHADRARSLRRLSTRAEAKLWSRIRNRQLDGFKFVRPEPIGRYFVDFACRERNLIVEVDGGHHAESGSDHHREAELAALGYQVIRFLNNDVLDNIDGVLQALLAGLRK
jgi:very-short-patch-repair endonuclease